MLAGKAVGAATWRLHGLSAEWKALWRGSDTVPEAVAIDRHRHVKMLIC